MTAACGIDFKEASDSIETAGIEGVTIPFATPQLLLRMKQTHDIADRILLHRKIAEQAEQSRPEEQPPKS